MTDRSKYQRDAAIIPHGKPKWLTLEEARALLADTDGLTALAKRNLEAMRRQK